MKTTVYFNDFREAFRAFNRLDNFSHEGLETLFDYLMEYEDSTGEELELDVIALCCDFNEDHYEDIAKNYDIDISDLTEGKAKQAVMDYLCDNTSVCGETSSGSIVYQVF